MLSLRYGRRVLCLPYRGLFQQFGQLPVLAGPGYIAENDAVTERTFQQGVVLLGTGGCEVEKTQPAAGESFAFLGDTRELVYADARHEDLLFRGAALGLSMLLLGTLLRAALMISVGVRSALMVRQSPLALRIPVPVPATLFRPLPIGVPATAPALGLRLCADL